ncbi:hypothetical protein MTP99_005881 [Tenebrio molitor]|nr:hypothetical protein MTP99_005881 [Tenebrio molitor]
MPKPLPKRSKEMIASLIEYFTKEGDHGGPLLSLKSIQQRVADALKINLCTVSSVNNQVKAVSLKNVKFEGVFMRWLKKENT